METRLPRGPVLDWSSFRTVDAPRVASVQDLAHTAFTTSGRAAIYQALLQLQLPKGSGVLVPTYHCPTMVAPILLAGLTPCFFGLDGNGLPALDTIADDDAARSKAMLVSHYFGFARSLSAVRQWCDRHGIALIEDCAHCLFGAAGDRPIGAWGDFATASLSKFLPMAEGGVLASARRPIAKLTLSRPGLKAQVKGWVDVLEPATLHGRLAGINTVLSFLLTLRRRPAGAVAAASTSSAPDATSMMHDCDMARVGQKPSWASRLLNAVLPRSHIITRRRSNYAAYGRHFAGRTGARPLFATDAAADLPVAPYVFPLWVDDAEPVYQAARTQKLPVFRWDRTWPGTPVLPDDTGARWSRHVLQLLCHQDLSDADITSTAQAISDAIDAASGRRLACAAN
jgi:hypothetical protein